MLLGHLGQLVLLNLHKHVWLTALNSLLTAGKGDQTVVQSELEKGAAGLPAFLCKSGVRRRLHLRLTPAAQQCTR